jgi:hypothetical protein
MSSFEEDSKDIGGDGGAVATPSSTNTTVFPSKLL